MVSFDFGVGLTSRLARAGEEGPRDAGAQRGGIGRWYKDGRVVGVVRLFGRLVFCLFLCFLFVCLIGW